ncbi:MAG: TerD family protein [Magnetococcales bacterium]|nr:TerD family protein [Magnetococcales bacterium]
MEIQRGQRQELIHLVDPQRPFVAGVHLGMPAGVTVDCACFGLDGKGRATDDRYVTFFNQPATPCGGVALAVTPEGEEGFEFRLHALPPEISRLVLVASLDGEGLFSAMGEGRVRLLQGGGETGRFTMQGGMFADEKGLMLLEFYRKEESWRVCAVGQGFAGGLEALCNHFGVAAGEEDGSVTIPMPPLSLLPLDDAPTPEADAARHEAQIEAIERTLGEFKVKGKIVGSEPGPVVTTYALDPAPGVKLSRVIGLEPDLALAMSSPGLRIDPIFDHGVIGIEIPNPTRDTVPLRRILEAVQAQRNRLLLPLGVDARGGPVVADLEQLPHLLVAGTTRSGKSVALHGIMCGLMLRNPVAAVRLVLVDPKRSEFSLYDNAPHLLAPVVTEARQAVEALHWLTGEMESRYQRMRELGVRNLDGWRGLRGGTSPVPPLLVVVVDELADLMLQSGKGIEEPLARLAQMGRAAGLHLILATQRPSRDVLTGLIKSNIPARLAFKVTSKTDARIILDEGGAENLLGAGDGLFIAPGQALRRIQAPMVSDANVIAILRYLRATAPYAPDAGLMAGLSSTA